MSEPSTTQLEAAAALLGPDIAAHVGNALAGYRRALEFEHLKVPPLLVRFARLVNVAARNGQLAALRALSTDDEPMPSATLTYRQAAAVAGVSERTIRRRVASGDLPARRTGRRVGIAAPDLFAHLEEAPWL